MNLKSTLIATALLTAFSSQAQDQVTLAEWTFEKEYETTADGANTYYTPTANDHATDVTEWFNKVTPYIYPETFAGNQTDSYITAFTVNRYYQLCTGYNNKVFRIENASSANEVTDYTNPEQHKAYYEIVFPTKGYRNITLDYALAAGNNTASDIEAVVSTDGGNTWFDAGKNATAATWWTYDRKTVTLSANNKDQVRVRLLPPNGAETNWNMDYVVVKGEAEAAAEAIDAKGATITWDFNAGTATPVAGTVSVEGATSTTSYSLGSNLYIQGIQATNSGVTMNKLNPNEAVAKQREENTFVKYTVIPKKGVTFAPKTLEFCAAKYGTSGGTFDVVVVKGDKTVEIAKGQDPARNNVDPFHTAYNFDISELAADGERMDVFIYIYNLAANKQLGISNVVITGDFAGTPEAVPSYTLAVKVGTEGAGNVAAVPAGNEFDEGTEITVTATENFGYHFSAWTDADGKEISKENPYTFPIEANTVLYAQYTKNNVYALTVDLEGGANPNLVQFEPAGNVVNGIHHYEEGTEVKLTALNNRILTFTNWDDNSTEATRVFKVNEDINVTAVFSAADYIVGWDLYQDDPSSERAADYKAESENAGLLSLHNAEGATMSWLAGGVNKGQQRGRYCARVWRPFSAGYYFEISFSTKGYSNIVLSAVLGNDFPSYKVYDVEYSVDGTNYEKFASYELPNRGWTEGENALPEAANDQQRVWIRFMADKTSGFTGSNAETANESTTDGFSIADIYVLGEPAAVNDETAPALVSSIPAENDINVSSNGQIVLTFDEKVVLGTGKATLGGEELTPILSGKTVAYKYTGLDYNTSYTFKLAEGALTDRSGNKFAGCEIHFTTMDRHQPEARTYDAVVAQDGSGDYKTVQEAVDAAPEGRGTPWLIFVKEGTYNEHVNIPEKKPYLYFIGQNSDKVIITDDKLSGGENALHVDLGATVVALSNDLFFEGISFENKYGVEQNSGPQALALNTHGDRVAFNNVKMRSYQDTWITTSSANNRHYVNNSWIEGAVDFIYNNGNLFVENTTINIVRKSGGYIVAPRHATDTKWGYVFVNNTITAPGVPSETSVWLGRPWHDFPKTVFINTKAEVTIPAKGWYPTMGGLPVLWADYNTVDGNGNPMDLSQREDTYYYTDSATGEKVYGKAKNYLTDEEAAEYTVKNVMGGDDNWQPRALCEPCATPVPVIDGNKITWDAVPYSICYIVTCDGKVVDFVTETEYTIPASANATAEYTIQAANEFGSLSEAAEAKEPSSIEALESINAVIEGIYSADGIRHLQMQPGVNIVRYRMSDGRTMTRKIVIK